MDANTTYEALYNALVSVPKGVRDVGIWVFIELLIVSSLCALYASFLYVSFYSNRDAGSEIHKAFPLLSISITALFLCIQFSLPLSLGLLGALSIVRFRTPIKEPEEIGFIMLVIATSISIATFNILFAVVLLMIATLLLFLARVFPKLQPDVKRGSVMTLSQSNPDTWTDSKQLLEQYNVDYQVLSFSTNGDGWTTQLLLKTSKELDEFLKAAQINDLSVSLVN